MRILALVPGGISEQLLFFPTLEDLKANYPNAKIDAIVEPRSKAAYRLCPSVQEVLLFDYQDRNGLADYLNLLGIIRDREYDAAITVLQRLTSSLMLWLNGIPIRIGYQTKTPWFLSHTVPLKSEQYAAELYHDLLQGFGIQSPCPPLTVALPKEDIDWAISTQKRLDIKESGYILIQDSFSESASTYPVAQWQKIIADIQQKQPDLPIVLLSSEEDPKWVAAMTQAHPYLKTVQTEEVGKLAAIIAGANLMLCTDSMPMQLAIAVGTYTIALFGPTESAKRLPPNQDRYIGISSPTGKTADIPPETVLAQLWRS